MKSIFVLGKPHSVQRSLLTNPPKGYNFIPKIEELEKPSIASKYAKIKNKLSYNLLLKMGWELSKFFFNPIKRRYRSLTGVEKNPRVINSKLILSGEILPVEKPYWIDLEHVRQLMGWDIRLFKKNKRWIAEGLSKKNCALITSWTKAGINTVIDNLPNNKAFRHKCYYVHNALPSVKFKRNFGARDNESINFLFMSSYNLPYDFNFKGGNVALEAFSRLSKKYPEIKLIVKSWVPSEIIKKYAHVKSIKFEGISPYSEMQEIFKKTDIFLSPNHNTPAQAFLDCMNYSIPIITTDLWANSEIVRDNYNGLLIQKAKHVPYFFEKNIPNSRSPEFNSAINKLDEEMVVELMKKAEILINSQSLRKRLGLNGKKEIENGEFSIKQRNKKYKMLLDKYF